MNEIFFVGQFVAIIGLCVFFYAMEKDNNNWLVAGVVIIALGCIVSAKGKINLTEEAKSKGVVQVQENGDEAVTFLDEQ